MAVAVGPGPELLEDPRGLRRRGVDEAVADRLRSRRLLLRVSRVPFLVVRRPGRWRAAPPAVGSPSNFGRAPIASVTWIGDAVVGVGAADRRRDRGAPVAALGDVAVVAEAGHQLGEHLGDLARRPTRCRAGLPENPNPGSDGATTWNASAASPPNAVGSVSGSMTLWNSTIDPGQPWVMISGMASGCGERTWTKCRSRSSIDGA